MMTIFKTANEAIQHSEESGEIGRCEDTPDNHAVLETECDDQESGNDREKYWADDPDDADKMLWRVNVEIAT